jgi:ubiquinone/menaquinone biosynthesis C-methylase UbiE
VLVMAAAFPASTFVGYDISRYALDRAEAKKAAAGATNVSFLDPRDSPIPSDHSVDFLTTFDCIHDMTHPQRMMESIRGALGDDGTWLLVDIKALDTFEQNVGKNPMASLMYGISVLSCMSSANVARKMAERAGFARFRKLDIDHAVNAFYEIRP